MISSINFYRIRVGKYYRGFPPARVARELGTNHFYGFKQINILSRILKTPRTTRPLHGTRNCMYKPVVLTPSFLMLFYFFSLFSFSLDLSLLFSFFFLQICGKYSSNHFESCFWKSSQKRTLAKRGRIKKYVITRLPINFTFYSSKSC